MISEEDSSKNDRFTVEWNWILKNMFLKIDELGKMHLIGVIAYNSFGKMSKWKNMHTWVLLNFDRNSYTFNAKYIFCK